MSSGLSLPRGRWLTCWDTTLAGPEAGEHLRATLAGGTGAAVSKDCIAPSPYSHRKGHGRSVCVCL